METKGFSSAMDCYYRFLAGGMNMMCKVNERYEVLIPERVIYNDRATVCIFPDGDKVVVKATKDDKFSKEHGVAMCIMRKLFKSRSEFLRIVNGGYEQEVKGGN